MSPQASSDATIVERLIQQIPIWSQKGGDWRLEYDPQGHLQRLDLSYLSLTTLAPEVGRLSQLQELRLSHNQLTWLPAELWHLAMLDGLFLDHNQLTRLPAEFGQLRKLSWLYLSHNQLTQVPPELGKLSQLRYLSLSDNQLTWLPAELWQLPQLYTLNLDSNQLAQLPAEVGQLSRLQRLGLSHNRLTQLPAEVGQLSDLGWLHLENNHLTHLPRELGQLASLQQLYLTNNQLTQVPTELGQLSQLKELDLSHNQLTQIPAELGQLSRLEWLDLANNHLTHLPVELEGRETVHGLIDKKHFWLSLLAEPGFLILPNGLTAQSTTQWIRPWSGEGQRERMEDLCDEEYEVRFMDTYIWFEQEPVKEHIALLSSSSHQLQQLFQTENIVFPAGYNLQEETFWSGREGYRLQELYLQEAEELVLKELLLHLGFILSEIGLLQTPRSYSGEMNRRVALRDYIEYGFCYISIEKSKKREHP